MNKNRIPFNYTSNTADVLPCRYEIGANGQGTWQYTPFPPKDPKAFDYVPAIHGKDAQGEYIRTKNYQIRIAPTGMFNS